MRGKLMLVAGAAVGYVLGSRAGRARYEQIAKAAGNFWHSRPVQRQVNQVGDFAKSKAPDVVDFVTDNVKKAVGRSATKSSSRTSPKRTTSGTAKPTPSS